MDIVHNAKDPILPMYVLDAFVRYINDTGQTPFITCLADKMDPTLAEYARDGVIVLNLGTSATQSSYAVVDENYIYFRCRFNGVPREIYVPIEAVISVFCREQNAIRFDIGGIEVDREAAKSDKGPYVEKAGESKEKVAPPVKKEGNVTHVKFGRD